MDVLVKTSDSGNDSGKRPDDASVPGVIRASGGIKDRLAALQRNGGDCWQKRAKSCQLPSERLQLPLFPAASQQPESPPLLRRKTRKVDSERPRSHIELVSERLQSANNNWKQRVPQNDAEQFTVAGKMGQILDPLRRFVCPRSEQLQQQPKRAGDTSNSENSSSAAGKTEPVLVRHVTPPAGETNRLSSSSLGSSASFSSSVSARDVFRELDTNSAGSGRLSRTAEQAECTLARGESTSSSAHRHEPGDKLSLSDKEKGFPSELSADEDGSAPPASNTFVIEEFAPPKSSHSVSEEVFPPKSPVSEKSIPFESAPVTEEIVSSKSSPSVIDEVLSSSSSSPDEENVVLSKFTLDKEGRIMSTTPPSDKEELSSNPVETGSPKFSPEVKYISPLKMSLSVQNERLQLKLSRDKKEMLPSNPSKLPPDEKESIPSNSSELSPEEVESIPSNSLELSPDKEESIPSTPSNSSPDKEEVCQSPSDTTVNPPEPQCDAKSPVKSSVEEEERGSPVIRRKKADISVMIDELNDDSSRVQKSKSSSPDDASKSPVLLRKPQKIADMHSKLSGVFARGPPSGARMGVPLPGARMAMPLPGLQMPSPRLRPSSQPRAQPPAVVTSHDSDEDSEENADSKLVEVPRLADEEFERFFSSSLSPSQSAALNGGISRDVTPVVDQSASSEVGDWSCLLEGTAASLSPPRLVSLASQRVRRHVRTRGNPVRSLQTRDDLVTAYTRQSQYVEDSPATTNSRAQQLSKRSTVAVEALAGLAARIDFSAVKLSPAVSGKEAQLLGQFQPYRSGTMLLQVKGRRHVQTRLVPPLAASVNKGDCYILITPEEVFGYLGGFSNKMERSRAADICQYVARTRDLGCSASQPAMLEYESETRTSGKISAERRMWKLLGSEDASPGAAGSPEEDEQYEADVIRTNRMYEVCDDSSVDLGFSLRLLEDVSGHLPRYSMLQNDKVFVFDFGSEMYLWTGQWASHKSRVAGKALTKQLWQCEYDYSEFGISPVDGSGVSLTGKRPDWGICGRVGQNMETVLFKEKFLDWGDSSNVLKVRGCEAGEAEVSCSASSEQQQHHTLEPVDARSLFDWQHPPCNLVLERENLGRGTEYYDEEERRLLQIESISVSGWCVSESSASELSITDWPGQMYRDATYVWRWHYRVVQSTRSLSGGASRHSAQGRDRCAYFFWQGLESSVNDKGASALMVVELDKEHGPQVRVSQGRESAAFFRLFDGRMVVYRRAACSGWRLFVVGGTAAGETFLLEVEVAAASLRQRAACLLLHVGTGSLFLWLPVGLSQQLVQLARDTAGRLQQAESPPAEMALTAALRPPEEVRQGAESAQFKAVFDDWDQIVDSLSPPSFPPPASCPRLFSFTLSPGRVRASPVLCLHVSSGGAVCTPLPYTQRELYDLPQPALLLLDAGDRLLVWQGWRRGREDESTAEQGEVAAESYRWQQMRRCVFTTAISYSCLCEQRFSGGSALPASDSSPGIPCQLAVAGLEPRSFQQMFPEWCRHEEAASCNLKEGYCDGEYISVADVLAALNRDVYPLSTLLSRPLPDGVDPARLETFLSDAEFKEVLKMEKDEFASLPAWKQTKLKKSVNLF